MSSPAGHETPEEKAAIEDHFTSLVRNVGQSGPTGTRIAQMIAERRARRDQQTTKEN